MTHFKIKIELKSDLCAQSGSGHGSYIDSDVCFDKFGFPYIPAKRLKGCLADACNELIEWNWNNCTEEDKKRLFGEKGLNEGGSLSISNAYIENYKEIYNQLDERNSKADNKNEEHKIRRSDIINYFTSTRTRTAIDEESGTAKDGSLRTIRVINCIDPIKKEIADNNQNEVNKNNEDNNEATKKDINRVFIAEASLSAPKDDDKDKKILENCCKALRHIGSNRTRGFGAVKLTLDKDKESNNERLNITISDNCEDTLRKKIKLQIRLDSPIMISSNKASESMDYIPGSTVLGYFAGQYLKSNEADEEFYRLFVNGQEDGLKFSNFYISDKNNSRYFPAPITCKKKKQDGTCYNSAFNSVSAPSKALTDKYISDIDIKPFDELLCNKENSEDKCNIEYAINKERLIEVKREVFYHHARPVDIDGKKVKDKAIDTFYQYNAISADQYFTGEIEGKKEDLENIVKLLNDNNCKMRIGKSKTAQYGSITVIKYKEEATDEIKISVNKDNELAVVAQAHIMFFDDLGGNIIKPKEIIKRISKELFGTDNVIKYDDEEIASYIKIDQIGGYNRKWNLERPPVPAIAPGSVFVFTYKGDKSEIKKYISIGERQHEGLGKMYVWIKEDAVSNEIQALEENGWSTTNTDKTETQSSDNMLKVLENNINKQKNLLELKKKAFANAQRLNINSEEIKKEDRLEINSTTINNLLVKCLNYKDFSEFISFVDSIKDKEKKEKVRKLLFEDTNANISNKNECKNNSANKADKENKNDLNSENRWKEIIANTEKTLSINWKYYYANLLTQCKLNIRINGNEKGGENND